MKTIITLDKANQPYGFPQLNGNGNFNNIIVESGITSTTVSATTLSVGPISNYNLGSSGYIKLSDEPYNSGFIQAAYSNFLWTSNNYYDPSFGFIYEKNGYATQIQTESQSAGVINFLTAPSGIAGNVVNYKTAMQITNNGNISIGSYDGSNTVSNKLTISAATDPIRIQGLTANTTDVNLLSIDSSGVVHRYSVSGLTGSSSSASGVFLPLSGGTVTGGTIFTSGVTANTISQVNYIDFRTSPTVPNPTGGTLYFDSNENALSYKPITPNNDVTVNLGQESLIRIYNDLGFQINNGQALHITGATSGSPTVSLAIGTGGDTVQFQISGIATHDIPNSSFGFMTVFGTVRDLNLTGFTVGEQIYLSQTVPGGLSSYSGLSITGRTCEVGHILDNSASGKIQVAILNEIEGTIITTQENNILAANNSSTGLFEFSGLSISTPSGTTFNVGPVEGWIIDNVTEPESPTIRLIIYTGSTGNTALYVSSATETYILLTSGLTITQQTTFPTPQQRRQNLYLGKFGHANRQYLINAFNEPDSSLSPVSQLRDMFTPIRLINGGVYPSANGNSLTFNTSGGVLYGLGIGYITNKLDPNSLSVSGTSPCTFQYRTKTGGTASNTTLITPGVYDNNGVVTAVGGGSNSSTNQRIYLVQNGQFRIQYGQQVYGSLAAAIEASQNETFTTFSNFRDNGTLIGILSVNKNATNLSDTTQARFLLTSKFGETVGAAGGISTTNLQQAYNNSATPEIVTNSAEGALTIQNGTVNADNVTNLFEGKASSSGTTSFIRADGLISGSSVAAVSISATTWYGLPSSSFSGGTVTGPTNFTSGLTATTISATTYENLPTYVSATTLSAENVLSVTTGGGSPNTSTVNAVTGGSYSNGVITLSGTGNVNGTQITGLSTGSTGGGGITWNNSTTTQSMVADNGYITTASTPTITVFTLPSTIAFGKTIEIGGYSSGLWQLNQNSGQQIRFGNTATTVTSGILSATSQGDSIRIVCTVADTNFMVVSSIGNVFFS